MHTHTLVLGLQWENMVIYSLTWSVLFNRLRSSPESTSLRSRTISFWIIIKMVEAVSSIGTATAVWAVGVAAAVTKVRP